MQMEKMLTEIGSYSLFHEYLNVVGAASPALTRIKTGWEYKQSDRLLAQIRVDDTATPASSSTPAPFRSTDRALIPAPALPGLFAPPPLGTISTTQLPHGCHV
jgi:hypothetical protein